MMSKTPEDFCDLVKQEFGYIWDGKGGLKRSSSSEQIIKFVEV